MVASHDVAGEPYPKGGWLLDWSRFCALQSRVGDLGPTTARRPAPLGTQWTPTPLRKSKDIPQIQDLERCRSSLSVKGNVRSEFLPARPNPQDSTILSSSTAGVCLIWAWLSWVPWKWIKNYTTFQLSLDLIIVRIFNAVLLFWLDYLSYFIPRKIL